MLLNHSKFVMKVFNLFYWLIVAHYDEAVTSLVSTQILRHTAFLVLNR
jgi:hypothetical protein